MAQTTEHIFAGAMTIDGTPVNSVRTYDNRKISKMINDENGGFYSRVDEKDLNHRFHNCKVYVWVSEDE
jgi:hypothetical protein